MDYNEIILIVNATAILILMILAFLLLLSTKFRGENAYAAAIIVLTTIPVYEYNVCRSEEWYEVAQWLAPLSFSVNTLLMPLLWLFTYRNFNAKFRLTRVQLLHFLPAAGCLILFFLYFFTLPPESRFDFMIHENTGEDTWIGQLNAAIVFTQMFVYFTIIFVYLFRTRKYIMENLSEAEWLSKQWIPKFMILFAGLFLIVFVSYTLWPRTDAWLIQIINVVAMSYLVFHAMETAHLPEAGSLSLKEVTTEETPNEGSTNPQEAEQLKGYAADVVEYLQTSQAYLNPNLTLQDVAVAMGISPKKLSKAINTVLNKNFFELVNHPRIEKAKTLLPDYKEKNLTLDMVAGQCGFNSSVTFSNVFKKGTGKTPAKWSDAK